jgi:hypothetical protein
MKPKYVELVTLITLLVLVFLFGLWLGYSLFDTPNLCYSVADTYALYGLEGI